MSDSQSSDDNHDHEDDDNNPDIHYYRQYVDNRLEVIALKKCFIRLGPRCPLIETQLVANEESSEDQSSDEEFKYFGRHSDTESYDSEDDGFHRIVDAVNAIVRDQRRSSGDNHVITDTSVKPKPEMSRKTARKSAKRPSKGKSASQVMPKEEIQPQEPDPQPDAMAVDSEAVVDIVMPSMADESLLEDDFYATNMELFLSQSVTQMSQSSQLVQQTGRFAYYPSIRDTDKRWLKVKQPMDGVLRPLSDLCGDERSSGDWSLALKVLPEYAFAFRNPSKTAIALAHRLLAHYDWSQERKDMAAEQFRHLQYIHSQFVAEFMREILLSCYTRLEVVAVIAGGYHESNAWPFVSKLMAFLVNESIKKSEGFALAFTHFKLIVDALVKDFRLFVSDSKDLCHDIHRKDSLQEREFPKPVIARIVWGQKSADYINSVFKQLIYLTIKVIKIRAPELLLEVLRLYELCAECLRVGAGNVRPFVTFVFNKVTPITELCQQLVNEDLMTNEVMETLVSASAIPWIRLQFCAHFVTKFIVDLKSKYINEKKRQISLKLIVECLTNARILSTPASSLRQSLTTQTASSSSPPKTRRSGGKGSPIKKRSSLGLVNKRRPKVAANKQWSKRNKYGENGLHTACIKGQTDKLRELLAMSVDGFGLDPNECCFAGYTPLCEAAIHGRRDCIEALIEWQKAADKRLDFEAGPDKQTALHDCIENNNIECVQLILESGGLDLLRVRRTFDGKTPADVIKTPEMTQMIDKLRQKSESKVYKPKINVKTAEDSRVFIKIVTQLIHTYIETTKINRFVGYSQHLWPNMFFDHFQREMTDADMSALIEDLAVFRKLPKFVANFKQLFNNTSAELIDDLELALSFIDFNAEY